jgi:aminoglycoside phosphotransferase
MSTVTADLAPDTTPALAPDLAADPMLPARDVLLDPGSAAGLLGAHSRAAVSDAVLVRTKYRIGESLRVLYRVTVEGSEHLVAGRMSPPGQQVSTACPPTASAGPLPPVFVSGGLDTVWWNFPHDRRLRGVGDLLGPEPGLVEDCGLADQWTSTEVVQWTPERGLTVRAVGPTGTTVAYVKAYAPGTVDVTGLAARYDLAAEQLAGDRVLGALRAPRALAALPARDLLVLEPVPGRPWLGLAPADASRTFALLGRSIAVLHEQSVAAAAATGLGGFGRFGLPRLLRGAELVATARPDLAVAARRLAARLETTAPTGQQEVVLHGDCHPGNLLVGEDGVSLIDLDQSGLGPAAADLGSLLARLQHGMLAGERTEAVTMELGEAFLAGYSEVRPPPSPSCLRWYIAAALLGEQAVRSVNRVRGPALARLDALLAVAETIRTEGALP